VTQKIYIYFIYLWPTNSKSTGRCHRANPSSTLFHQSTCRAEIVQIIITGPNSSCCSSSAQEAKLSLG